MTQSGGVVKVNPASPAAGTAFPIATLLGPRGIAADRQGNLWAVGAGSLVKIAPSGAKIDDVR